MNPIKSKIFNFLKFIDNLDVKAFLDNNSTMHCGCTGSPFMDKDLKHIITDSFKIIENKKLRKFFSKGLKYCEKRVINYQKA